MTPRQRILSAIARKAPAAVPSDMGGCGTTSIAAEAHAKLCEHLGIRLAEPAPLFSRKMGTVYADERVMDALGSCTRPLLLGSPRNRPERTLSADALIDEWGVRWERPGWGHFIAHRGPLQEVSDPGVAGVDKLEKPDPADQGRYEGFQERAEKLHQSGYAVVYSAGPGPVHTGQWIRGYSEWLLDLHTNPKFILALNEAVADFWEETTRRALELAGPFIDVVMFGDDVGTQKSAVMSPGTYRALVKPFHRRMVETAKKFGKPVFYHSCGSVYSLIPDFIDIGIDVLNPVQVSARNMEPARLKREFGKDLCFWGAIDTQHVLPHGQPSDVRSEVRRRIDELSGGGGYVVAAVHNIQADVPPANIVALFEEVAAYGTASRSVSV